MADQFTTQEVAQKIGVSRQSLHFWIRTGRIVAPPRVTLGRRTMRIWSNSDVARLRAFMATRKRAERGFPHGYKQRQNPDSCKYGRPGRTR
jgi:DNA-binding transcriptional MerR regulator